MKLVRFGSAGKEKPGIIDKNGKIRDLSKVVKDIDGKRSLPPASPRSRRPTSTSCRW
jgi:5-carboxymethyl-2-hydroxymuconate isomerase